MRLRSRTDWLSGATDTAGNAAGQRCRAGCVARRHYDGWPSAALPAQQAFYHGTGDAPGADEPDRLLHLAPRNRSFGGPGLGIRSNARWQAGYAPGFWKRLR